MPKDSEAVTAEERCSCPHRYGRPWHSKVCALYTPQTEVVSSKERVYLEALRRIIAGPKATGIDSPEDQVRWMWSVANNAIACANGLPAETPAELPDSRNIPTEPYRTWMPQWLREFHCQCESTGEAAGQCVACQAADLIARGAVKTERKEADSPVTSDKCEHGIPRRFCTAVHAPKCLVADCPEPTADGQAMCAEHIQRIEP